MTLTIEFPEQLSAELEVIPKTGYYTSTSEFLKDAVKTILAAKKDLMVSIAIELYKKDYSLGRVAEIADLDYEAMKELLVSSTNLIASRYVHCILHPSNEIFYLQPL